MSIKATSSKVFESKPLQQVNEEAVNLNIKQNTLCDDKKKQLHKIDDIESIGSNLLTTQPSKSNVQMANCDNVPVQ